MESSSVLVIERKMSLYVRYFKRIFDLVLSLLAVPAVILIIVVFAPLIYFEDRGKVFYSAPRTGRKGKVFIMYKLRTMYVDAPDIRNKDGSTFSSSYDPRVTKIGKILRVTSLDETPQIVNVLLGEMSIVGPRPTLATIPFHKLDTIQRKRLVVKPGITGYSQAYFRNSVNTKEKFSQDIFYVNNISLKFDIQIIFRTILTVLKREKINADDSKLLIKGQDKEANKKVEDGN